MLNKAEAQVNKFHVKGVQQSKHCPVQLCCLGSGSTSLCFNLAPNGTQRYLVQYEDQVRRFTWPTFEHAFQTYSILIIRRFKCRAPKDYSENASDLAGEKIKIACPK